MQAICERFNSAQAGYGDIVIGDDKSGDTEYLSSLISAVGTITIAAANS